MAVFINCYINISNAGHEHGLVSVV